MNAHSVHPASPLEPFLALWRNRSLVWQMSRREVVGRYRGSVFGLAWSFFNPILMLLVYTFVFSVVFQTRWGTGEGEDSKASFAIILFVGMVVHGLFAECANRAPNLILGNVNYVKKVVFPLEVLPWVALGSALFHAAVSTFILLIAQLVLNQSVSPTLLLFPLVIFPLILVTMGFSWFLAATGVYFRDIGQTIGILTMAMLFLAPVFYPLSAMPERFQSFIKLNPLTFIIEEGRKVLILGEMPNWNGLAIYMVIGFVVLWAGFWWFQKTRNGFADII